MDEKCVCHINGYRLKDTEARKKAEGAEKAAEDAKKAAKATEDSIAATAIVANQAKSTADGANVTARTAAQIAKSAESKAEEAKTAATAATRAEKTAAEAKTIAAAALPRAGGIMAGIMNMGGNTIENVRQVHVNESIGMKAFSGDENVGLSALWEPGVLQAFQIKSSETGTNNVIFRGVADPANDSDAVNLKTLRRSERAVVNRAPDAGRSDVHKARISFMDDDCRAATHSVLFPIITKWGIPYTLACAPGDIGKDGFMSVADLMEMVNAGVTVSCHHFNQDNMDDATEFPTAGAYAEDLENCIARFNAWGIPDVTTISYPQGKTVDSRINTVKRFFRMGFTVERGINTIPYASYFMHRNEVFPTNGAYTLDDAKALVDTVAASGGWLIFMTHAWYGTFNAEQLDELIDYIINTAHVDIVDIHDAIDETANVMEVGFIRKPLSDATKPYFIIDAEGGVWVHEIHVGGAKSGTENVELVMSPNLYISGATGNTINASGSSGGDYLVSDPVDVSDCASVIVTGWAYDNYYAYAFYKEDGTFVSGQKCPDAYGASAGVDHAEVPVPAGAKTIRVATNKYKKTAALTKVYAA